MHGSLTKHLKTPDLHVAGPKNTNQEMEKRDNMPGVFTSAGVHLDLAGWLTFLWLAKELLETT